MTDSTCEICIYGKRWRNQEGNYHRLDGPAVEWDNGDTIWWVNGRRHRLDGPAVELGIIYKEWWVNGKELSEDEFSRHPLVVFYQLSLELV
jgi:hypothetical protein